MSIEFQAPDGVPRWMTVAAFAFLILTGLGSMIVLACMAGPAGPLHGRPAVAGAVWFLGNTVVMALTAGVLARRARQPESSYALSADADDVTPQSQRWVEIVSTGAFATAFLFPILFFVGVETAGIQDSLPGLVLAAVPLGGPLLILGVARLLT